MGIRRWLTQHWAPMTIYRKVLSLYFLCMIPVALFGGLIVESNAGQAREQAHQGALLSADIAAANANNYVEAVSTQIQMLAATPGVTEVSPSELKQLFQRYLSLDTNLDDLLMIDSQGRVIATGMSLNREVPDATEAKVLQSLAAAEQPVILNVADWFVGRQRPVIFAHPVVRGDDRATLIGVVAAWRLYRALSISSSVQEAEIFLTDREGYVIAHPNWMFAHQNPNLSDMRPVVEGLKGNRGTLEYSSPIRDEPRIGAFAPVSRTGWAVVVSYPKTIVAPPARLILLRGLATLAFVLTGATVLAAVIGRHIVQPLEALTSGVEAVAGGDFHQQVVPEGNDEVGRLSGGFNRMVRELDERAAGLKTAKAEIAAKAEQLVQLLHRSINIQEEERRRIANDLHDGLMQVIVGTLGGLQAVRSRLSDQPQVSRDVGFIEQSLQSLVSEVRSIIYALRPPRLEAGGLMAALEHCVQDFRWTSQADCRLEARNSPVRLAPQTELAVYRVCQESLQNVVKHADASAVSITVVFDEEEVVVTIADDGRGFSQGAIATSGFENSGLGLLSMRERLQAVGGTFQVISKPGRGTVLVLRVPSEHASDSSGREAEVV